MRKEFREKLAGARGFGEIFELVKRSVREVLGLHRAGLELVLMDLPNAVGAFHQIGSNLIVMNRSLLEGLAHLVKNRVEVNSYVFVVLLHEYLHSLGFMDEEEVRVLVKRVVRETLGEDHMAYHMADASIYELYPELKMLGPGEVGKETKLVKDFDRENTHYIG